MAPARQRYFSLCVGDVRRLANVVAVESAVCLADAVGDVLPDLPRADDLSLRLISTILQLNGGCG